MEGAAIVFLSNFSPKRKLTRTSLPIVRCQFSLRPQTPCTSFIIVH